MNRARTTRYLSPAWSIALALAIAASAPNAAATLCSVISTFDTDTEGWHKLPGSDPGSFVEWVAEGGNPGGYMRYNEVGAGFVDFVSAPAAFLGDKSAYYGGTLSFDIKTNTLSNPTNLNDQVRLHGGGIMLRFQLPNPSPVNEWHHRSMELTETAGWIIDLTGQPPTQAEMLAVLSDVTGLHLLADYRSGPELVCFDNISLTAPDCSNPGDPNAVCDWSFPEDLSVAPTDLNSLLIWLDASTIDARDGADVTVWQDQSGNGNDLISASKQPPFLKATGANGLPSVGFGQELNRSDPRYMDVTLADPHQPGAGPAVFAILTIPPAIPNTTRVGVVWGNFEQNPNYNLEVHTNGRTRWYWNSGQSNLFGTADARQGQPVLISWYRNAVVNRIETYLNGNPDIVNTNPGTTLSFGTTWRLGFDFRTSGAFVPLIGDIAEFMIYDRSLLDNERLLIEYYLASKYGILIPYRRPVELDGSGSYDADKLNLTYVWTINGQVVSTEAVASVLLTCGEYEAVLIVTNEAGKSDQCVSIINVVPARAGDLNCDGVVDGADLLILLSAWGKCDDPNDCPADLNDDGVVDGADLLILLSHWG